MNLKALQNINYFIFYDIRKYIKILIFCNLKSCGRNLHAGSIPAICTNDVSVRTNNRNRKESFSCLNDSFLFFLIFEIGKRE